MSSLKKIVKGYKPLTDFAIAFELLFKNVLKSILQDVLETFSQNVLRVTSRDVFLDSYARYVLDLQIRHFKASKRHLAKMLLRCLLPLS